MDFLDPTHKIKELQLQSDQNMSDAHYHGLSVWQDNEKGKWKKSVEKLLQNLKQDDGNVTSNIVFHWDQEGLH